MFKWFVWFIWSISLIWSVWFNQTDRNDQSNRPALTLPWCRERCMGQGTSQGGGESRLADSGRAGEKGDFFSVLLGPRKHDRCK